MILDESVSRVPVVQSYNQNKLLVYVGDVLRVCPHWASENCARLQWESRTGDRFLLVYLYYHHQHQYISSPEYITPQNKLLKFRRFLLDLDSLTKAQHRWKP